MAVSFKMKGRCTHNFPMPCIEFRCRQFGCLQYLKWIAFLLLIENALILSRVVEKFECGAVVHILYF